MNSFSSVFINLSLRGLQMLMGLYVVKLSYEYMTREGFLLFNELLFYIMISSILTYPVVQKLWHETSLSYRSILDKNILYVALILIISGGLHALKIGLGQSSGFILIFPLFFYGLAKLFERLFFTFNFTHRRFLTGYIFVFFLLSCEIIVIKYFSSESVLTIKERMLYPGLVFLILALVVLLLAKKRKVENPVEINRGQSAYLIVYMAALTIVCGIDRYYTRYLDIGLDDAGNYLLLFSFALACQSFFTAIIDWGRPFLTKEGTSAVYLKKTFMYLSIAGLLSLTAGFYTLRFLKFIPEKSSWYVWCMLITSFWVISCVLLFQVGHLYQQKYRYVFLFWLTVLLVKLLLIKFFVTEAFEFPLTNIAVILVFGVFMIMRKKESVHA